MASPIRPAFSLEKGGNFLLQDLLVRSRFEVLRLVPVRLLRGFTEILPKLGFNGPQTHMSTIPRFIKVVAGKAMIEEVIAGIRDVTVAEVFSPAQAIPGKRPIHHGHIDELPLAQALAGQQGGDDTECRQKAATSKIGDLHAAQTGLTTPATVGKDAAESKVVDVMARFLGTLAFATIAVDGTVDKPGIDKLKEVISQAQPSHDAGSETFEDDICLSDESLEELLALRKLKIEGEGAFIPV